MTNLNKAKLDLRFYFRAGVDYLDIGRQWNEQYCA